MHVLDQKVRREQDRSGRRSQDRGVVADPDLAFRRFADELPEPLDKPELTDVRELCVGAQGERSPLGAALIRPCSCRSVKTSSISRSPSKSSTARRRSVSTLSGGGIDLRTRA